MAQSPESLVKAYIRNGTKYIGTYRLINYLKYVLLSTCTPSYILSQRTVKFKEQPLFEITFLLPYHVQCLINACFPASV